MKLAGVVQDDIVTMAQRLIQDRNAYAAMAHAVNPYGDGQACLLYTSEQVQDMPAFPAAGAVAMVDGTVVVKLS